MLTSSLRDLRERKAAKVSEMTTLHEASVSEDRSFSDDEQARWDSLEKEISVIDEQYDRQSKLDTDAENREEDDREIESRSKEEWRINRRSHSESDNDPNRPLTQFEKSLILSTWVGNQRQFALRERGLELCDFWLVQLLAVRDLDLLVYVVYIHMNSPATMVVLMRQMNLHVHAE